MTIPKIFPRLGLSLLVLLIVDQVTLYTVLNDDVFLGRQVAPFDPPLFADYQRAAVARIESHLAAGRSADRGLHFDAELGWCNAPSSGRGEFRYDWAGCRIGTRPLTREKPPGMRRIVTLGCSMTHGEEVGARETWPAILDELLDDIEVANLGVAAYGMDQALMRYRRDGAPLQPDEVWLALLPPAALRPTTLFRPLLRHWSLGTAFKPRFRLGQDDRLLRIDNPAENLEDVVRLLSSQEEFLAAIGDDDRWVNRAPLAYAPRGSHWLHYSSLGRLLLSAHEASGRSPLERIADTSGVTYRLHRAIAKAAESEAREEGARFRYLILPDRGCLEEREEKGRGSWEALCEDLTSSGIEVIDLCDVLERSELTRDRMFAPEGHLSPAANRVVAKALADSLRN
jgi:hypothetical protein